MVYFCYKKSETCCCYYLPTENTENQIEHKKWSNHNEGYEKYPVEGTSKRIIGLKDILEF